jgi:hypothetical protein
MRAPQHRTVAPARWLRLDDAARILGVNVVTLRRAVERHTRRDPHGRLYAEFDGVHARKLGRHWRVFLDACWAGTAVSA